MSKKSGWVAKTIIDSKTNNRYTIPKIGTRVYVHEKDSGIVVSVDEKTYTCEIQFKEQTKKLPLSEVYYYFLPVGGNRYHFIQLVEYLKYTRHEFSGRS